MPVEQILTLPAFCAFLSVELTLIYSGEAYLSYSIGGVAYMGFLAAYFASVNNTVYPEVFYGPVKAIETSTGIVSARGWLVTFHFVLALIFLLGHIWHALRARAIAAGFDFKNGDMVQPPQVNRQSNQASLVNSSDLTLKFLKYLPIYRRGISPLARGLEIGMAHGYWLVGPFATLGSLGLLGNSDVGNLLGLLAAGSLILILTIAFSIYGTTSFERQQEIYPRPATVATVPRVPQTLNSTERWSQFTDGFLIGGIGGVIFAYLLLNSVAVFAGIAINSI
ncbi:hypothetical protein LC653_44120 [Nostoc sp. CHAB 5784]|uniref:photosystem I reaction center subunit XI n=1 Tax=Nostoc mirabile TaxID=2907820 RepID=UPI001E580FFA|nr:photosystem I reaction center subunit XI [Nostoc mirabile]MCC5670579.1 hypothetical protein [Nostoc mirabile CHAB5784]